MSSSTFSSWQPRSTLGLVFACIYFALAIAAVIYDRKGSGSGGWITIEGILSYLITFPISFIGELLGSRPDFRRNVDMGFAILSCTTLVYFLGTGLAKLARLLSGTGTHG